jgi:hypothetical protein
VALTTTDVKNREKFKIQSVADINDAFRRKVAEAYNRAEQRR